MAYIHVHGMCMYMYIFKYTVSIGHGSSVDNKHFILTLRGRAREELVSETSQFK